MHFANFMESANIPTKIRVYRILTDITLIRLPRQPANWHA